MRLVLISDIHSNFDYLKNVMDSVKKNRFDKIYCLGDLTGYYDSPNKVINYFRMENIVSIKGNHDKYVLGELEYNEDNDYIYNIKNQKEIISLENLRYLEKLPDDLIIELKGKRFFLTHSLPGDTVNYIKNLDNLPKDFIIGFDYYIFGHTHIPIYSIYHGTYIVNPGSVGQPRDYSRNPSFSIIDIDKDIIEMYRVNVDYIKYISKLKNKQYNQNLVNILQRFK